MYNWVFDLATGEAQGADEGKVATYDIKCDGDRILISAAAVSPSVAAE